MLTELLDALGPDPHPALVAATVPTSADVMRAAGVLGWLPPGDGYFTVN